MTMVMVEEDWGSFVKDLVVEMMKKTVWKSFSFEESGEADGGDGLHSQPI